MAALHLRRRDRRRAARRRSTAMSEAGFDNVLALRGDPPAGPGGVDEDRGRPRVLARARRAHPRRLPVRDRRRLLPRDAHPRHLAPRTTCATSRRRSTPACGFLITQLFFDNAAVFDFVAPRAGDRHRRADHPGDPADHEHRAARADHVAVRRDRSRRRLRARARHRRDEPRGGRTTSASPTRRCSAPSCWPAARPGSTSTRSTAARRRGRSSAR